MFLFVPILFFCSILQSSVASIDYVQNLAAIAINSTALNITWSGPFQACVRSYNLTVSSTQQVFETITIDTNIGMSPNYIDQEIVFGGLSPFTEYTVVVDGVASGNVLLTPSTVMQTTLQAIPGAPEISSVNVINSSTIEVTWHAHSENGPITSFIIDFSNSIIPTIYIEIGDPTMIYFTSEFTVEEGITYSVSVRAVNGAGESVASASITVTTPVVAPPQVVPFLQSELTNITLNPTSISFLVPILTIPFLNGPLIGYTIGYTGTLFNNRVFQTLMSSLQIDQTEPQLIFVPAGNNITVINLLPNYDYLLSTSASNSEGTTDAASLTFILPPDSPGAPINVALLVVSYQQINVSWSIDLTTVNGLLLYFNIYYYTTAGYSNMAVYNAIDVTSVGPYTMSLTGLSPNTLYSISVTIVNEVSEGSNSSVVEAETHPTAPGNNITTTVSPTQITSNTIQIYVPTQQLFTTADIAVIYIIADSSSPPLFSSYTANQRYSSVVLASSAVIDVTANVRIQALLDDSYYNQQTDYVRFSVGDGGTFLFNGLAVDNIPLRSDTEYQISYYILFYNADGQLSLEFAYYSNLDAFVTSHRDICLACFLIPICAFVVIMFILVVVLIAFIYYYLWSKHEKQLTPPSIKVSPKKEIVKAQHSLIMSNPSADVSPVKEMIV